ncbi:MAG TPA: thioredoxin family protein [Phycisphaerales bacterium]|nr:thioredoxin family protein [Phycisphaerales bacterium]
MAIGKRILSGVCIGLISLAGVAAVASAQDEKKPATKQTDEKPRKDKTDKGNPDGHPGKGGKHAGGVSVGQAAPTFTLKDTSGKEHNLSTILAGGDKVVVLEWFNPDCPVVKMHHGENTTFKDLAGKYKDKPVVFLAINSGAAGKQGAGLERNKKAIGEYGITYPVLLDESGDVGRAYGAKTTPHMFVIGKDGKVAYMGAIDDKSDKPGKTNYVSKALDELLAGTTVSMPETKPYGCSVKY